MKLGIDFGTTNSAAAVIGNDGRPHVLPLDAGTQNAGTLRTVLYVERDGHITIGSEAIALHRAQNVGRLPRFTKQWITEIDVVITEGATIVLDVFSDVDADAPGRLLHSLKGPLASTYEGTTLFGKHYALEALIAEFLSRLRFRIEQVTGETVTRAVLGRPVNFANAHSPEDNAKAEARLREAATLAGFTDITFEMEPIAAGLSYGTQHTMREGDHALVFDFGGGTLDVAVIRVEQDNRQYVLATGGVGIAGDHFDRALFKRAVLPWLGEHVRWGQQRLPLPTHLVDALSDWQDAAALCNRPMLAFLRQAQRNCTEPIRLLALEDYVSRGYAYDVFERVERSKVALSQGRFDVVVFDPSSGAGQAAIAVWQPVTRALFESAIARECRLIREMIVDTLQRANVQANDVQHVIRTGGSSSIPVFIDMLAGLFGRDRIVEENLFTGVAAGLAVRAEMGIRD
jgi:hypothetical chaperone protein